MASQDDPPRGFRRVDGVQVRRVHDVKVRRAEERRGAVDNRLGAAVVVARAPSAAVCVVVLTVFYEVAPIRFRHEQVRVAHDDAQSLCSCDCDVEPPRVEKAYGRQRGAVDGGCGADEGPRRERRRDDDDAHLRALEVVDLPHGDGAEAQRPQQSAQLEDLLTEGTEHADVLGLALDRLGADEERDELCDFMRLQRVEEGWRVELSHVAAADAPRQQRKAAVLPGQQRRRDVAVRGLAEL
mmetsp:Transcript_15716/g.52962  ORF Transcript_15716/g.52962 Transcript_15716/m.52962 type:complete len:240 (-) Transcript_15716:459-1178(-)